MKKLPKKLKLCRTDRDSLGGIELPDGRVVICYPGDAESTAGILRELVRRYNNYAKALLEIARLNAEIADYAEQESSELPQCSDVKLLRALGRYA